MSNDTDLRELIRVLVFDDLGIVAAVEACHATADKLDDGLKRAMPCYDAANCDGKRCGDCDN